MMSETYCGKNCLDCEQKDVLTCPGCQAGPGSPYGGSCDLAKCCRDKGHKSCSTCGFSGHCGTLRGRERMPEYRLKSMEAEKNRVASIAKRAPVLGRWLWILFWLFIPSSVASILTNDTIAGLIPGIYVPGMILSAVCSAAYGCILIRLHSVEERYRTAGICGLIGSAAGILLACITGGAEASAWSLLISIPTAIVSLVATYHELTAYAMVLTDVDDVLSEKWFRLWKWFIGTYGSILGSLVIMMILPILGLLIVIAAAIGLIVVSILKLVYLYRTAKVFRNYQAEDI